MRERGESGYRCVYLTPNLHEPRYYFRFTWHGKGHRSNTYRTALEAYEAYKRRFMQVVKESFDDKSESA